MHIPGIKVIAPTNPHDAKGSLIASIRDNNPVIFVNGEVGGVKFDV